MAQANVTSPAEQNTPRPPNDDELLQLAHWLADNGHEDEGAILVARGAYVAVYDHYMTGGPGYVGKLMSVVWDGAPSFFDVFTWEKGVMQRSDREYDEKECCRCGNKNGTLCWSCWRSTRGNAA
jgi:hypothetical protein